MSRLSDFARKHREVLLYLFFGVLTTLVGWAVYFAVLIPGKAIFSIPVEETSGGKYLALYTAAQIIQWIAAVLFAFFTNRKWVFEDGKDGNPLRQLPVFAGGRLATLGLDYLITYFGARALSALFPRLNSVSALGREWNLNEIGAKIAAAVVVIVTNYFFSKFLVFKKKKAEENVADAPDPALPGPDPAIPEHDPDHINLNQTDKGESK